MWQRPIVTGKFSIFIYSMGISIIKFLSIVCFSYSTGTQNALQFHARACKPLNPSLPNYIYTKSIDNKSSLKYSLVKSAWWTF